ncbi:MAG: hypothetical protein Q7T55_24545, partial [Solirubrobacteraceae bacterium]|nr:hypothetical protein [Solirubrobacteraceae bacterium]
FALTGLQPNTRYYYRAVATNATGRTTGSIRTFLTLRDVAGVSVKAARTLVAWGGSTVLTGVVTGGGIGGVQVRLMRQDFPYSSAPKEVAAMTTSDAGIYSFAVGPIKAGAKLWVQTRTTPFLSSKMVALRSKVRISFRTLKRTSRSSTVRAVVNPRITSAKASLQRRTSSGRWVTVKRPRLSHSKGGNLTTFTATIARRSKTERYRVVFDPNDKGAHVRANSGSITVSRR